MTMRPLSLALVLCCSLFACKKQADTDKPDDAAGNDDSADANASAGNGGGDAGGPSEDPLTADSFEEAMERNKSDIADCFATAKSAKPDLAGKLSLDVTVSGQGEVDAVAFDPSSTIKEPGLTSCVEGKAKAWKFPKTSDGAPMTLPYSLTLQ